MKKCFLFFALQVLIADIVVEAQLFFPNGFEDYHIISGDSLGRRNVQSSSNFLYSPYGKSFTPRGDMKILIICAGLGEPYDNYPMAGWEIGTNSFPDWVVSNSTFYTNNNQFLNPTTENDKKNISRFFYEMSKGDFRLTAGLTPY